MFASVRVCDTKYSKFAGYCFFSRSLFKHTSDAFFFSCIYPFFLCVARFSPVLLLFVEWTDCSSRVFCFPNQNVDKQMERKAETKTLRHTGKKAMLIIFAFCFLVMFSPFFFLNTKWVTVFHSRQIPLHTAKFLTANAPKCYYNKNPTSKLQFIKHERCNSDEMVISICR